MNKFNRKIDGELKSRETEELSINIISPLNLDTGNNDPFLMQSMSLDELFIIMPANLNLVKNLTEWTPKYDFYSGVKNTIQSFKSLIKI